MLFSSLVILSGSLATAAAETIFGITVVSRHGDRTSKHYPEYALTTLGSNQAFSAGNFYRNNYIVDGAPRKILGVNPTVYSSPQIYAAAPDQLILMKTTTGFLQGLYPPLVEINAQSVAIETINNGTAYIPPLSGYQYAFLHSRENNSPDTIWIKGDEQCPAFTNASATFRQSPQYLDNLSRTKSFYAGFWSVLQNVYDYTPALLTYAKAYDIFDLIYVASIHNKTVTANVTAEQMFQLRTLADSAEFSFNYNASQPLRMIGGAALLGQIYTQLNTTVSSQGKLKVSLFTPSYNNILSVFGLTQLTASSTDFYGLPPYASTLTFELYSENNVTSFPSVDDLMVRAMFRNGSDAAAPIRPFAMFGRSTVGMSWKDFSTEVLKVAITSPAQWCKTCGSTATFCLPYTIAASASAAPAATSAATISSASSSGSGISNVVAGVIGAMVMLGVATIFAAILFLLRKRSANNKPTTEAPLTKEVSLSNGSF